MSEKIEVSVGKLRGQNGHEIIVQSKSSPFQKWVKWYFSFNAAAEGTELTALGLADRETPLIEQKFIRTGHRLKEEVTVEPDDLLRCGFHAI